MLNLVEAGGGLVLSYPLWLGALSIFGIALLVYAARPKAVVTRRWAILVVGAMLTWAGIYFATFKVTLTPESGRVYAFLDCDARLDWQDAVSATVVQRQGKGGPNYFIVLTHKTGGELELPLKGLNDAERQRVIAYVYGRMPR
jgi:hypothetical protein